MSRIRWNRMKFIETKFFISQLNKLKIRYNHILSDYEEFKLDFDPLFATHLWNGIYKVRCKISSIPIGKSGGFRFIVKVSGEIVFLLLVYAKSIKENVTSEEIISDLESVKKELKEQ